jgi:hypothetical protein
MRLLSVQIQKLLMFCSVQLTGGSINHHDARPLLRRQGHSRPHSQLARTRNACRVRRRNRAERRPATVTEAVEADIILFTVGSVAFKDVGAVLQDWSGKIVIDVTNDFMLPPEVQQAEYQGRLTSEVNAERVPGAKLVKAFNQLPFKVLASPLPTMSVEGSCSSRATMRTQARPSRLLRKALALQPSKSARLQKVAASSGTGTARVPESDQIPAVGLAAGLDQPLSLPRTLNFNSVVLEDGLRRFLV